MPRHKDKDRHFEVRTFLADAPYLIVLLCLLALPVVAFGPAFVKSITSTLGSLLISLGWILAGSLALSAVLVLVLAGEKLHRRWTGDVGQAAVAEEQYERRRTREQRLDSKVESIVTKHAGRAANKIETFGARKRTKSTAPDAIELDDMSGSTPPSQSRNRRAPPPPPPL